MVCSKCNNDLPDGSLFCYKCGEKVDESSEDTVTSVELNNSTSQNMQDSSILDNEVVEKKKNSLNKGAVLVVLSVFIVVAFISYNTYKYSYVIPYGLENEIKSVFSENKWDDALNLINSYEEKYGLNEDMRKMLSIASINSRAESLYKNANELYQNKSYKEAYNLLGSIDEKSSVYSDAKKKQEELANILGGKDILEAIKAFENKEFIKGYQYLNYVLMTKPNHEEALSLQQKYSKQYDAEIERKKLAAEEAEKMNAKSDGVRIGMTQQEVLDSNWGRPKDKNKTITAYGTHEQWVYSGNNYLYFEDGILTTIQN